MGAAGPAWTATIAPYEALTILADGTTPRDAGFPLGARLTAAAAAQPWRRSALGLVHRPVGRGEQVVLAVACHLVDRDDADRWRRPGSSGRRR